jgi:DNA-directed RNA polymerase sigma subunit (sigma70/sigma32)
MEFSPTDEAGLDEYCRTAFEMAELSPDEEKVLALGIEEGDPEARERFVLANLRLVVQAARRHGGQGLTLLRLVQEGTEGLLHAVEAFDPRSGAAFGVLANQWIEEAMQRARSSGECAGNRSHDLG